MNRDVSDKPDAISMPPDAADAWAEVYIDVAEKLDAEERQQAGDTAPADAPAMQTSCPTK